MLLNRARLALASLIALSFSLCSCSSAVRRPASDESWSFAVLSDIHVRTNGDARAELAALVKALAERKPRFVIITGDSTSGNQDDGFGDARVDSWWHALQDALAPLNEAGIPVLPVAGNHDYYTDAQRRGYRRAWQDLAPWRGPISLEGDPPVNYSFEYGGAHFSLLHVVDQALEPATREFLEADSQRARGAALRLAFGHVPLVSAMGHTNESFRDALGGILASAGYAAYIAGHEHLVWDQMIRPGNGPELRQVITGTASAAYVFPITESDYAGHCNGSICRMPVGNFAFTVDPRTRLQKNRQTLLWITLRGADYDVRPLAYDEAGGLHDFGDQN